MDKENICYTEDILNQYKRIRELRGRIFNVVNEEKQLSDRDIEYISDNLFQHVLGWFNEKVVSITFKE